jgi:hypothetical protein
MYQTWAWVRRVGEGRQERGGGNLYCKGTVGISTVLPPPLHGISWNANCTHTVEIPPSLQPSSPAPLSCPHVHSRNQQRSERCIALRYKKYSNLSSYQPMALEDGRCEILCSYWLVKKVWWKNQPRKKLRRLRENWITSGSSLWRSLTRATYMLCIEHPILMRLSWELNPGLPTLQANTLCKEPFEQLY